MVCLRLKIAPKIAFFEACQNLFVFLLAYLHAEYLALLADGWIQRF